MVLISSLKLVLSQMAKLNFKYRVKSIKKDDVIVVIMPDHGSRYIGKIYNDEWMKRQKFL